jgi:hypothetical protein
VDPTPLTTTSRTITEVAASEEEVEVPEET